VVTTVGGTTLAVRLDSAGDVLLAGPALRALAAGSERLVVLAGPRGGPAAELLPGIDDLLTWHCPWIDPEPQAVDRDQVEALVRRLASYDVDRAVVFTSFHQSPLPIALLLRLAGVPHISAISEDYPGSLLDVRHRTTDDQHEVRRALGLARAAGFELPPDDWGMLGVRHPLPAPTIPLPDPPYVVLHPGTSVPARAWPVEGYEHVAGLLVSRGIDVVVTGGPDEEGLTHRVAGRHAVDLGGRTSWAELAAVLQRASVVVVGNTGPAHLAAAVGTPVVSLFAPTVPARRWAPYGVPSVLLGDQEAVCRDSRVVTCPYPGHPCLTTVSPDAVVDAVDHLGGDPGPGTRFPAKEEVNA
jgi:ADP-heptose:LPS heptosyltransferase